MNNLSELDKRIDEIEQKALNKYLDYQGIAVSDYVNEDILDIDEYVEYLDAFKSVWGDCFLCGMKECDPVDCNYFMFKKESEQTNENSSREDSE